MTSGTLPPPPDLGILVIHGIGQHKQGETLNEFAAPVVKWIDQWLTADLGIARLVGSLAKHTATKDYIGQAAFESGTLRPPDLPLDTPAHARATIHATAADRPDVAQTWLFAESWWSPQTLTPRVSAFLLWLITRGPWLMLMHLSQRFGVDHARLGEDLAKKRPTGEFDLGLFLRGVGWLLVTLLWLAIALALIGLWCVVSLVALVPIGYVRRRVFALLIDVTGVIGDSYVLINDPIQRVAFANSARSALAWLRKQRCARLAVVAHSQGAAVAYDVLFTAGAQPVDLLVTLGPGIAKLHALAERERWKPQSFLWAGAAAPLTLLAVASFIRLQADGETGFAYWSLPVVLTTIALTAIFITWHGVAESLEALKPSATGVLLRNHWQPGIVWRDLHATHDPVSNGSLSATIGKGWRRLASRRVTVLASLLADHTSYWRSRADVVPRVVAALDRCAATGLFPTRDGLQRVARGARTYRHAVTFLRLQRWAGMAALLVPLFAWTRVAAIAADLRSALVGLPIPAVAGALDGAATTLAWLGAHLFGYGGDGKAATAFLLLAAATIVILVVWGRIVAYWWQHLAASLLAPVFTPSAGRAGSRFGRWLLAALVATLGTLPPVLSIAWTFYPDAIAWSSLRRFFGMFLTFACIVGFTGLVVGMTIVSRDFIVELRAKRRQPSPPSWWRAVAQVPEVWFVPAGWLLYVVGGGYLLLQNRYAPAVMAPSAVAIVAGTALFLVRQPLRRAWRTLRAVWRALLA